MKPTFSLSRRFSIVLPVHNGGEHLKLCVASILAQTLADEFELVILENASTDGTAEWLATLRDERVRVLPAARPLSMEQNWARIQDVPKHEFMTTIGHDDLYDPRFLEVIAVLIRDQPSAGLYCTHFRIIGASGGFIRHCRPMPARETAAEFVAARLCDIRDSFGTGHMLRTATYDALGGIPSFPKLLYADDALFTQAIGLTYRATALEEVFAYRAHARSASASRAWRDLFHGFEEYAHILKRQSEADGALAEVLRRYFAVHALRLGRLWRNEELLTALQAHAVMPTEVDERINELACLFCDVLPAAELTGAIHDRLLEYATRSILGRGLYSTWRLQKRYRLAATETIRDIFAARTAKP